ncbi:hypothetical protein HRR83_008452 [Exophiala dermatitidis]|uniref:Uncharacterized protein n=1 Tax=Exophiala dermatitidis TaxID=5970 RepID=A0AAN6ENC9_EXODE|nr:hypothetical protein HRR73_008267 [Exophiala dermatitidis]KAJ4506477.1 hypothetical protein HRR74_008375 [Exophiala dermatitidis]KAJ4533655.1 hypothetical protein HRR77_008415 [Exophiala dermatitidis]KAJ4547413.1 hypothetical protein HRR76_000056 [Exophiala dermatitidis]KAJ4560392.1 hypothetical protein HRR79_008079 [Exophiala dermatitidis]
MAAAWAPSGEVFDEHWQGGKPASTSIRDKLEDLAQSAQPTAFRPSFVFTGPDSIPLRVMQCLAFYCKGIMQAWLVLLWLEARYLGPDDTLPTRAQQEQSCNATR